MRLTDCVSERFVVLRVGARDVAGALGEIAWAAEAAGLGPAPAILAGLQARERLHPTEIGGGMAIPHAPVQGLERPVVGVARIGEPPLPWGGADHGGVRLVFTILSPPGMEREHVRLLARICRLARHEAFARGIESAGTAGEVVGVIRDLDALHP